MGNGGFVVFLLCVCGGFLPHGKPWGTVALCFLSVFVAVSCPTENRGERWLCVFALCLWWFPAPRKTVGNGGSGLGLQPDVGYVDEVVHDGVYRQSGWSVYLQLAGYVALLCDDGVQRYEEVVGDFLVRHPLGHTYHNLLLPLGQFRGFV